MAEEKKTQSQVSPEDMARHLAAEDELFSHILQEEDKPAMRVSLFMAALMHLLIISITIPSVSLPQLPRAKKTVIYVRQWRPPPPPKKQKPKKIEVEKVITKKVPIPDPTPEEPEPIIEPEPEPELADIPLDAEFLIGAPEAPPSTGGILIAGIGGVTNPELIGSSKVSPKYPDLARKAKIEGQVILQALIDSDGTVKEAQILKSPGAKFGFDEEAINAIKQWRYKPGLQNGRPVAVYFTVIVTFRLED